MGRLDRMLDDIESRKTHLKAENATKKETTSSSTAVGTDEPRILLPILKKRIKHHVSRIRDMLKVIKWMVARNEVDSKQLITNTISKFRKLFAGSKEANCVKARRWWDGRFKILRVEDGKSRCEKLVKTGKIKGGGTFTNFMKTIGGSGRKRRECMIELHSELLD